MSTCGHSRLVLLPAEKGKLRCRHCHLTIRADELDGGHCPECFEADRTKRYEFEEIIAERPGASRYRCEECGVIIESR